MGRTFIIGNGPSLTPQQLEDTIGFKSFAVNRIWKIFGSTFWRPTDYVRCEFPVYDDEAVREDLEIMADTGCVLHIQDGFRGCLPNRSSPNTRFEYFKTCDGNEHLWHLPEICAFGTVVHAAMQIAASEGATELILLGCDLGLPAHFYGEEGIDNNLLAVRAHEIANQSCPVPVYSANPKLPYEVYYG